MTLQDLLSLHLLLDKYESCNLPTFDELRNSIHTVNQLVVQDLIDELEESLDTTI